MKSKVSECIEYESRNYPDACGNGVKEGELLVYFSYALHQDAYSIEESDITRFRYIEQQLVSCDKCRSIYEVMMTEGKPEFDFGCAMAKMEDTILKPAKGVTN